MFFKRSLKPLDGKTAEKAAERYLNARGLTTLTKNYSCRQGEIDLIMDDASTVVFVEVRYRKNAAYGSPLETVTAAKQKKLLIAAKHYLSENKLIENTQARFDVIGICGDQYEWVKSAF